MTTSYSPASSEAGSRDALQQTRTARAVSSSSAQRAHVAVHRAAVARRAAGARRLERPHRKAARVASCDRAQPRVVATRMRGARRLEHPGADEARAADGVEHGREALDALLGRRVRRRLRVARRVLQAGLAGVRRAGEAREALDLRDQARRARRRADGLDESLALEAARHGLGHAPPVGDANRGHAAPRAPCAARARRSRTARTPARADAQSRAPPPPRPPRRSDLLAQSARSASRLAVTLTTRSRP